MTHGKQSHFDFCLSNLASTERQLAEEVRAGERSDVNLIDALSELLILDHVFLVDAAYSRLREANEPDKGQ